MKKIKIIGRYRSFFEDLFNTTINGYSFEVEPKKVYEIPKRSKKILLKIFNLRIFDFLGLFTSYQVVDESQAEYYFSYNRFVRGVTTKYIIYLENPLALVNYSRTKMFSKRTKKKVKAMVDDPALKKIVCMSKSCFNSFHEYYGDIADSKLTQIYPLFSNQKATKISNSPSAKSKVIILFIGATFVGKGGRELYKTIEILNNMYKTKTNPFLFQIVTKKSNIPAEIELSFQKYSNVEVIEFNLSREELQTLYNKADVFTLPTRYESFGMVFLEAMKGECALIGPDIYATNELIKNKENGFIFTPTIQAWNKKNMLVSSQYRKISKYNRTSNYDLNVVKFLTEKLLFLEENRDVLSNMKAKSKERSSNKDFQDHSIINKWGEVFSNK